MKGILYLKFRGEIIKEYRYWYEYQKPKIIENWKKLYGKGFEKATISDTKLYR